MAAQAVGELSMGTGRAAVPIVRSKTREEPLMLLLPHDLDVAPRRLRV
jgi:hypothetical protein